MDRIGLVHRPKRRPNSVTKADRAAAQQYGIRQSMDSDGGHCHDNARCESMWARMKSKLFYGRLAPERLTVEELNTLVWRYFMSYWNRRRICSANGGLPPAVKRQRYFAALVATT